jgi:aminopeptidase N
MRGVLIFLSIAFLTIYSYADTYPKNSRIDVLNYTFRIELSDNTDDIKCVETVDVRYVGAGVQTLRLDLVDATMKVGSVTSEGKQLHYTHQNNELLIALPSIPGLDQKISYTITYSGKPASGLKIANNKYGDRTFFSDNWPDKGRHWLAIVDHPYDKATCEFVVTAPSHYQVVSNGLRIEETDLKDGSRVTHWKQSVPIASWLYVLGVARFAVQHVDDFDHKAIETWVYYQDRDKGFHDFAVPTKDVLAFYSDRIGSFAYEKLANIQSNSVSGGMEAASAILYSEGSVVGDRNKRWRDVVIHEIAHQWFGNAVTEYDWDDVWLSEGFATYFTLLFVEHQYGKDAFMKGLADAKKKVYAFQEKDPDYRVVHNNLADMEKVTSSQTYQKGAWILHMLRGVMGDDNFWKGIRSYYRKYMNANATTADFRREMEEASGRDLEAFFEYWLYQPGTLKVAATWSYDKKKKLIRLKIEGGNLSMPIQIGIYMAGVDQPVLQTTTLQEAGDTFVFPVDSEPREIILDPNLWVLMDATVIKR